MGFLFDETTKTAVLSPDKEYRYYLTRSWGKGTHCAFIMLNPSTADHKVDDPTIKACTQFAKKLGCDGFVVVNLFALRATDPKVLKDHPFPQGPDNDRWIKKVMTDSNIQFVIAAWGNHGTLHKQYYHVTGLAIRHKRKLFSLGDLTEKDMPRHPLYVSRDTPLRKYIPRP